MQIQKVQSNQTIFGTKVKMNPMFINHALQSEEYTRLRNQIKFLEENGCSDILSINQVYVPNTDGQGPLYSFRKVFAEVYEINGNKLRQGDTVECDTFEYDPRGAYHFPNIIDLYEKAKQNLCNYSIHISKWADYI